MTHAIRVARVRAGLLQAGWLPCSAHGCDKLTAPAEGETGPIYCALHDQTMKGKSNRKERER